MKAWKAWIARDWSGVVYLYPLKPQKKRLRWESVSQAYQFIDDRLLPPDINPQWSDEKPIEVNINITKASYDARYCDVYSHRHINVVDACYEIIPKLKERNLI